MTTYLVSYPRSGREWVHSMLKDVAERTGQRCDIVAKHDGGAVWRRVRNIRRDSNKKEWRGKRVILLTRDPRDSISSLFYFMKYRLHRKHFYLETKGEFIRNGRFGLPYLIWFLNDWEEKSQVVKAFFHLRYEDLSGEQGWHYFWGALDFAGLQATEELCREVMRNWSLQRIKRQEDRRQRVRGPRIEGDSYCRRGFVGAAQVDMELRDRQWMDDYIAQHLSDFFSEYKEARCVADSSAEDGVNESA